MKSVYLAAVYKSDDAKMHEIDTILKPIVKELKELELNAIEPHTPTLKGKVRIMVVQVVGSNLGLNAILGDNECFAANSVCRWRRVHRPVFQIQGRRMSNFKTDLNNLNNYFETGLKSTVY